MSPADPDIWTRLKRHRREWERLMARREEMRLERIELILEAVENGPQTLVADTLGVTRSHVSNIVSEYKEENNEQSK